VSFLGAHHITRADDTPATPLDACWQAALYVGQGLAFIRRTPGLYLLITSVYAVPALLAGAVAAHAREPVVWQQVIVLGLPWTPSSSARWWLAITCCALYLHTRTVLAPFPRRSRRRPRVTAPWPRSKNSGSGSGRSADRYHAGCGGLCQAEPVRTYTLFAALAHPGPSLIDVAIGAPLQWHPVATVRGARLGVI